MDLQDCIENMHEPASNERDERYRKRLLELIKEVVDSGEVDEALEIEHSDKEDNGDF
jgi:hypothetical protein